MPQQNAAWRDRNLGRLLLSATDVFMREKLGVVHAGGFGRVTEAHMALVQNLDLHGTRLTEIAARAGMTKQSMLELVDKAERLGFVLRRPDPDDQRAKAVMFTPAGLRMLARLRRGIAAAERRMAAEMGAAFMARMKERLAAYAVATANGQEVSDGDTRWRTRNAGRLLAAAARVFVRDVLRVVHEGGFGTVTEVHLRLFRHIDLHGTRLTEIAGRAGTTKQAMAELLGKTEAVGLIARRPDPDDGRAKIIVFTPMGLSLLEQMRRGIEIAERRAADVTGEAFLTELLVKLEAYVARAGRAREPAAVRAAR